MNFISLSDRLSALFKMIKKKEIRPLLYQVLLFILLTASCSFFSDSIKTSYETEKNTDKQIQEKGLYIENIKVNKSFDSETVKENAAYALKILLGPSSGDIEKGLKTAAVLKEESFINGFNQLNTVSLELIITDRNGKPLKIILITEESENTLSSYNYLYKILERGIKEAGL